MTGRWPAAIRLAHWLTALLVILTIPAAMAAKALTETNTDLAERLVEAHIAAGVLILAVTLARLSFRLVLRAPAPPSRPHWLDTLVRLGTLAFYALLIGLPATGLLKLSLSGLDVTAFGVTILPAGAPWPALARLLNRVHEWLGWLLLALAALHAVAALAHGRLFGAPVLRRMA